MSFLENIPLRRKLLYGFLITSVVALLAIRTTFLIYEYLMFRSALRRELQVVGGIVANNSTAALAFENPQDAAEILAGLKAGPHISAAALYKTDGTIFARYPAALPDALLPSQPGTAGLAFSPAKLDGFLPVTQAGTTLGTLYLRVDTPALLRDWLVGSLALAFALLCLFVGAAYLMARYLTGRIAKPMLSLAEVARDVAEHGDFTLRAAVSSRDELGQLARDFNSMLEKIGALDREIRSLNADLERRVTERTAQLAAVNRELEAFSYSVSHDLRAPLRHIDGFVQLLGQSAKPKLTEPEQRFLGIIERSARNMGVLIDELLSFSRMGRAEMRRSSVDMAALVAEVVRECQPPERKIDWQIGALPTVSADAALLRQVWRNLIGNAVKYSAKRERAVITIDATAVDDGIRFRVADNGAGFDMTYADKLFGVFQRLHAATEFEGTGIGLANVRRIIERHGGRVWAEAVVDRGATFFFTLPQSSP